VFDSALSLAEQGGKSALAAEAPDDPLGGVRSVFHGSILTNFSLIRKCAPERGTTTTSPMQSFDGVGEGHFRADEQYKTGPPAPSDRSNSRIGRSEQAGHLLDPRRQAILRR
jgi:hypothetical protein